MIGQVVKSILITPDNQTKLFGRFGIDGDEPVDKQIPLGWSIVVPFGERAENFWMLLSPETYSVAVDDSDAKPLENGFYEVILKD